MKIDEDEAVLSFLDIGPVSDGHTLVIPKQHFERLHDCPPELLSQVGSRIGKIAKAVAAAMDSQGYNVLCNNGRAAGQLVDHLHFHIIPRNTGDGVFDRWPAYEGAVLWTYRIVLALALIVGLVLFLAPEVPAQLAVQIDQGIAIAKKEVNAALKRRAEDPTSRFSGQSRRPPRRSPAAASTPSAE